MDYTGRIITKNAVTPSQTSAPGVWTLQDQILAQQSNTWPVAGVPNPISRSLRFNSADSAYLNRTPGVAGNRKTWTLSLWNKGGNTSANDYYILSTGGVSTERFTYTINGTGKIQVVQVVGGTVKLNKETTAVYRDPSAWYHLVLSVDTTQSTPSINLYVNGVQATSFSTNTNTLSQNDNTQVNNTNEHNIGRYFAGSNYLSGYLTEINFIDGQALTPSSFGMTDPVTGVWVPKQYTGSYGTNGFYLNFKDNTSTTTLGNDYSGNGNNWTTNNFSVSPGANNDSMTDVPTQWVPFNTAGDIGGVVRGNYATLNPLSAGSGAQAALTNGNLDFGNTSSAGRDCWATITPQSGKWYWEVTAGSNSGTPSMVVAVSLQPGDSKRIRYNNDGTVTQSGLSGTSGTGSFTSYTTNDVIGVAFDVDSKSVKFYKNNTLQTTVSWTDSDLLTPYVSGLNFTSSCNFGQRPFAYTPPAGFLSLCTTNLPTPSIVQGDDYFNVVTYTGTGANQNIAGLDFQPDLVWLKCRSAAEWHSLFDSVRGVLNDIRSNSTNAEVSATATLTAFNSNGFSLGTDPDGYGVNTSTRTYVAWNWKANGAGVTNTAGTITSTVSANTTAGFSIGTYTGTGANATVGHGLGVAPRMIIIKNRNSAGGARDWAVYHASVGNTATLRLNLTDAATGGNVSSAYWNNTSPTSTVFSIGISGITNNSSSDTYVFYAFSEVAGYSRFGSYTGNGSTDGPFVFCGFRPRYVMVKYSSGVESWYVIDSVRSTYNVVRDLLNPNSSAAEATSSVIDFLSNGFKIRDTGGGFNTNTGTYIFAAFAENPFKYSLAR